MFHMLKLDDMIRYYRYTRTGRVSGVYMTTLLYTHIQYMHDT